MLMFAPMPAADTLAAAATIFRLGLAVLAVASCGAEVAPATPGPRTDDALSTALAPVNPDGYYVDQANRYFDALDQGADPASLPTYSPQVARWEWPPWLYLTGYGRELMRDLDETVKRLTPATVGSRDCRAFHTQPFARCRVSFEYAKGPCPIYEEFTFNDQGEITFIEAWSDLPGLLPTSDPGDVWATGPDVHRLSTRLPGLGNATGLIDPASAAMTRAAAADPEIADFVRRTRNFWGAWFEAQEQAGPDLFVHGCGWSAPTGP